MNAFAEHTTLPMSIEEQNFVPLITRLKNLAQAGREQSLAKLARMISLPTIQPSGRDSWLV